MTSFFKTFKCLKMRIRLKKRGKPKANQSREPCVIQEIQADQEVVNSTREECTILPDGSSDDLAVDAAVVPTNPIVPQSPPPDDPQENKKKHYTSDWSISDIVKECNDIGGIPIEKQEIIITEAHRKAILVHPELYYDFCMVCSDEDMDKACALKEQLCREYDLTGCMIYEDDFYELGRDIFAAYESMMERSTKIFFYISDNLNANRLCRKLQSGAVFQCLMSNARKEREKCVPVFPEGICRVPLPLSGIGGLEIPNKRMTAMRLNLTFTDEVRQRRIHSEQDSNERRKVLFAQILSEDVMEFIADRDEQVFESKPPPIRTQNKEKVSCGQSDKESPSTSQRSDYKVPPPSEFFSEVQDILQKSTSSALVSSSDVTITSGSAHIGHNITINYHYPATVVVEESDDDSTSDESSECDDF